MQLIKRHKRYIVFISIIFAIGLLLGISYYHFLDSNIQNDILNTINSFNNFRYNAILKDLTIMSLLLISSFFIIGIPFSLFYLFYEGVSLGFLLNIFYLTFKLKGLIYVICYFLINKLLILFLMLLFIRRSIQISRYIIGSLIYPKESNIKDKIISNFKSNLYLIIFVFLINIVLYFISPFIFSKLSFLLS